jgi:hypothetical protein
MALKLNWTHQLLAYADDVKLLGYNMDASKAVGPEINVEETKYMLCLVTRNMSRSGHKNSKQIV